jgi:hypothetical protein
MKALLLNEMFHAFGEEFAGERFVQSRAMAGFDQPPSRG